MDKNIMAHKILEYVRMKYNNYGKCTKYDLVQTFGIVSLTVINDLSEFINISEYNMTMIEA
jgi:hypothetical protein